MYTYKRRLIYLVTACLLVFVVTACGDALTEPETESAPATEIEPQVVSTATFTPQSEAAPASTPTDLPTEIGEPVSPISPVATPAEVTEEFIAAMNPIPGSEEVLAEAVADLSQQLNISPDMISLVSVEAIEWNDASLGCPQEGFMYAQVVTPGYLIVLEAQGQRYNYHTDQDSTVILCEE